MPQMVKTQGAEHRKGKVPMIGIHAIDLFFEIVGLCSCVYHLSHWYFHKKFSKKAKKRRIPATRLK